MLKVKNALISVSEKEGIIPFVKELKGLGINIIATTKTADLLIKNDIEVIPIEDITGFSEVLDGRVKTLHPSIFGAILADRDKEEHLSELEEEFGLEPIDLVVVNLYPFEKGILKGWDEDRMIELIDIGGVSLLRAAAKNYRHCALVGSPERYEPFVEEMKANGGEVTLLYRLKEARRAFSNISRYDSLIANFLARSIKEEEEIKFPDILSVNFEKVRDLRYGENPHQKSAIYKDPAVKSRIGLLDAEVLSGKLMSYNNWMDTEAAVSIVSEFEFPTVAIVKHAAPCGVGIGKDIYDAFNKAYSTDSVSAFGGIIAANREIDFQTVNDITSSFFEVVIAPSYEEEALKTLLSKKNMRIIKASPEVFSPNPILRCYPLKGGLLLQEGDYLVDEVDDWKVVSDDKPTEREMKALLFAWRVVKWVKSNGIVIAFEERTIGIGTGQPSRVDSVELAIRKAKSGGHYIGGTVLASDGFFPFRDSIDLACDAGITAIVEPGGSIRDEKVIEAANEHEISLVFTGKRHFRH